MDLRSRRPGAAMGVALAVIVLAACASAAGQKTPPRQRPAVRSPTIGHLVLRNHRVTFHPGDRISVFTRDGKVVARNIPLERLKAIEPTLHEALVPIVAGDAFAYAGL